MLFEGTGRVFSGLLGRFAGRLAPTTPEAAERLGTNRQFDLGLSVGDISGAPGIRRAEYLAQRGITGYSMQSAAAKRTDAAVQKAVTGILDTLGPRGTATGAGALVQDAVQDAAARGARRVEGAVATNLAPRTGIGTAGELAERGVQAGRTAFSRQGEIFSQIAKEAPPVNLQPLHEEALRIFREDILPTLEQNPTLGPKTAEWQRVVRLYRQAAQTGERFELSPSLRKALGEAALDKATYAPLRVINQVLATPAEMTFEAAIKLRGLLRDAGKGSDLLAGSQAEALATYLETGSRTSEWRGLRGILNQTSPVYEAAAESFAANRQLFESGLVEKVVQSNPESVLATMTNAEGRFNASRIRQMSRVVNDLPQTYGTAEEIAAGKKAWDTLRAEWFRREVLQDNVFGMADRLKRVDADVLQAWFPDLAGKAVRTQAEVTARAFESRLLSELATQDPSKIVAMIGASPAHVAEFETRINALPGPVRKQDLINRVRRAWTEDRLTGGDPAKLAERIQNTDPELLTAWFKSPTDRQALQNLQRLGNTIADRRRVSGMGAYESLAAVSLVGAATRGNLSSMLTTAIGYEGLPGFLSWAMYNPRIQTYLFEAASPTASVTSKVAAMLHAAGAYRDATQGASQP